MPRTEYLTGESWSTPESRAYLGRPDWMVRRDQRVSAIQSTLNRYMRAADLLADSTTTAINPCVEAPKKKEEKKLSPEEEVLAHNRKTMAKLHGVNAGHSVDLMWGKTNQSFKHGVYSVHFTLTNLPSNCGVVFLSGFSIYKEHSRIRYSVRSYEGGVTTIPHSEIKEVYRAFFKFLISVDMCGRRTLLFTDAINGENGDNYPSLYEAAKSFKLPLSGESHNPNSDHEIVSCWIHLDDHLAGML